MNSYPPELLAQLAPVMFVAGLEPPPNPQDTSMQATPSKQLDSFMILQQRLRDALLSQRKVAVWQPEKAKIFQALMVDADARFPPRKLPPAEDQQLHTSHSPLSPLTPSSPLYPDGLIAPVWVRKHTTLVPSVFVLFKRIYEHPPPPPNQTGTEHADYDKERESEERRRDTELSAEIAQRKRSTNERSIKLTAVLMASRKMLDDPVLDARLTFIRRQSGLDPRAALFVLSPVTHSEIGDFVRSLQEALYEPALDYYTNHSKRVRRKRNRHSQGNVHAMPLSPLGAGNSPRPLRPEGWTVRYEYKMACFAEFRGEDEVALKHYQDAYNALLVMFGSTAILPPRTKRWAEAKVLADCVSVKICKLYLYNNEHAMALAHHNAHMRKFSELSRGWGIGEETFEFWSWLARQHRVFAELLEQGSRTTLKIPKHAPESTPSATKLAAQTASAQRGSLEQDALRSLGLNPSHALQHPGFYYYMAARCTESRRERFLHALDSENAHYSSVSPGFSNEKKVDHLVIVLELYTRAYELFKKNSASQQGRQQLWIAYRIAETYYESGKFEMAVRFFERIAKTYRREKWDAMLRPLLSTWYACAQQLGDMELSVRLLLEMLGHRLVVDLEDPSSVQEDLLAVLKSTVPSNPESLLVDLSESGPLLDTTAIFWSPEVDVGEPSAFQITLTAPPTILINDLPFTSLVVHFADDLPVITIRHTVAGDIEEPDQVQRIHLGDLHTHYPEEPATPGGELQANLRWRPGSSLVLTGSLLSDFPAVLAISKLILTLEQNGWIIDLPLQPNSLRLGLVWKPRWLSSLKPVRFVPIPGDAHTSVIVRNKPHRIDVVVAHHAPAYLGEEFPVTIDVTNVDDREFDVIVDVLLHPLEVEHAVSAITFGGETSSSLIKGVAFGTLAPQVNVSKTLLMSIEGAIGDRTLDISVQSRTTGSPVLPSSPASPTSPSLLSDVAEALRTLVISSVEPIEFEQMVKYKRSTKPFAGLGNLNIFEDEYWDDAGEAHVSTTMTCAGQSGISVESVKLVKEDGRRAKVLDCFIDTYEEDFLSDWLEGDQFCDQCRISLARSEDESMDELIPGPGVYEVSWRRLLPDGTKGSLSTSRVPLPQLKPPTDGLVALLNIPTTATLHTPVPMHLTIRNQRPSRAANIIVSLDLDPLTDGFVVSGLRQGRLPVLLPGGEESLTWNLIPVECGYVKAPRIKVTDRRPVNDAQLPANTAAGKSSHSEGEEVRVVDIRVDVLTAGESVSSSGGLRDTILVLP